MGPIRIKVSSLDPDGRTVVEAGGLEIAVFLVEGTPHAFVNACPHEGNPLRDGDVLGQILTCAYHGWKFDLETGACLLGEAAARSFPAELQDEEIVLTV